MRQEVAFISCPSLRRAICDTERKKDCDDASFATVTAVLHNAEVTKTALAAIRADLLAVLAGSEGPLIAASALRRRRLPASDDWVADVVQTATVHVLRRFRDGATVPDRPVNAAAYATTVIKHIVHKMVEGRPYDAPFDDGDRVDVSLVGPDHGVDSVEFADRVRACVEEQAQAPFGAAAAALAYVTLASHPEAMASFADAPMPERGADEHQAMWWPALWLAGLGQLTRSGTTPSQSRRRQRVARQAQSLCERAVAAVTLEDAQHG